MSTTHRLAITASMVMILYLFFAGSVSAVPHLEQPGTLRGDGQAGRLTSRVTHDDRVKFRGILVSVEGDVWTFETEDGLSVEVRVTPETEIKHLPPGGVDSAIGTEAKVKVLETADGLVASKIDFIQVKFRGLLMSVVGDVWTFETEDGLSIEVRVTPETEIKHLPPGGVDSAIGMEAKVRAWDTADGLVASKIDFKERKRKFKGVLESVLGSMEADGFQIWTFRTEDGLSIEVRVTPETEIKHLPPGGVDSAIGMEAKVKVLETADGLVASKIDFKERKRKFKGVLESVLGSMEADGFQIWTFRTEHGLSIEVRVTPETEIKHLPPGGVDSAMGMEAKVKVLETADGLVASKIDFKEGRAEDDEEHDREGARVEFEGIVDDISGTSWLIGGRTVEVDGRTKLKHSPGVGDRVEVRATERPDGTLLALRIKAEDAERRGDDEEDERDEERVKFKGTVTSISGSTWVIDGRTVMVDERTELRDAPTLGDRVKVRATVQPDGTLLATRIEAD